ncbi:MAG: hypothetical protein AUH31_07560 [Armatimonadetes bacterium 13_1_40CM_64_14]|nr:MAG: hypothetical protein AUH31_07560 [Armatimonadetes bacterium 13_1_40CM_64_14]
MGRSMVLQIPRRPDHLRGFLGFGWERNFLPHPRDSPDPAPLHPQEHRLQEHPLREHPLQEHRFHSEAVSPNLPGAGAGEDC